MINIEELVSKGEFFDGHYKLLRSLNTDGATADVWLALDTNTIDTEFDEDNESLRDKDDESGMLVAIKIYRPKNALDIEGEQRFRDEFKIVYECRHENLLQPTSFAIYKDIPYLVLPYCKNGSSEQLIGKKQTTDEIWKFISDVASGLAKLHSNQPQIIHQDIKPANILIDNNGNFAITDFGISSKTNGVHVGYYDEENSGTLAYMAPERFSNTPTPIPESDIWAFGATLCEILTGMVPFGEEGGRSQEDDTPMPSLPGLSASIRNLIHACLQKDPKKRPTAQQILQAARLKQYPIKSKTPLLLTLGIFLCLLIGGAVYFLKKDVPQRAPEPLQMSIEECYEKALRQMNSDNIDTLFEGFHIMDSLSKEKYVPAMYQIVFTNGWYSDSISVQRKKLLGIEIDTNNFPKDNGNIIKTQALMVNILDQNDTANASINADVAYRLASYYGDERLNKKTDESKANYYLDVSEKWAKIAHDSIMENSIQKTRKKMIKKKEKE